MQFICFVDPDNEYRAIVVLYKKTMTVTFFSRAKNGPARDDLKSHLTYFPWDLVDVGDGVPSSDP